MTYPTASGLAEALRTRQISAVELLDETLAAVPDESASRLSGMTGELGRGSFVRFVVPS